MTAGIVIFDRVEELDFVGPWEMLNMWRQVAGGPPCVLVAQNSAPVVCAKGMSVNPTTDFEHCPELDYLLVPGGQGTRTEVQNSRLLEFVASRASRCQAVLSVCTGAFVLHAAGLLSGKRATTHLASLNRLRALGDIDVVEERFVRDGKIWSSSGVSAGIDLTLAFIASVAGAEVAGKVQYYAEYYPSGMKYGGDAIHEHAPSYVRTPRDRS